jgi:hypothetical protein
VISALAVMGCFDDHASLKHPVDQGLKPPHGLGFLSHICHANRVQSDCFLHAQKHNTVISKHFTPQGPITMASAFDDDNCNPTNNEHFQQVLDKSLANPARRRLIRGGFGLAALSATGELQRALWLERLKLEPPTTRSVK